jgi:hypothetical protein
MILFGLKLWFCSVIFIWWQLTVVNGHARVEGVDDGLALLHVARQPEVVELSGFFCLETDNVYIADFWVCTVCTVHFPSSNNEYYVIFCIRYRQAIRCWASEIYKYPSIDKKKNEAFRHNSDRGRHVRNQPPNSHQNNDSGMWHSAANFTPPLNFPLYLWSQDVVLRYHCYSAWSALLQIRLKPWAGLILMPQARFNLQQGAL